MLGTLAYSTGCVDHQLTFEQPLPLASRIVYSRDELIALCNYDVTVARTLRKTIFNHRLWLPANLREQLKNPVERSVYNSQFGVSQRLVHCHGYARQALCRAPPSWQLAPRRGCGSDQRVRQQQQIQNVTTPTQSAEPSSRAAICNAPLTFGLLNIRSIANKLDDLLEVRHDRLIDVLCLVETWHDADSATFRRLLKDDTKSSIAPDPGHRASATY